MNVLITGASGFLGTNLIQYLTVGNNFDLLVHTRRPGNFHDQNRLVTVMPDLSFASLNHFQIDAVIHLAGVAHDLSGKFKTDDYIAVNFENTARLYDEFLKSNAGKFIFVSSIKALTDKSDFPITESTPATPLTIYGKSKRMAEEYLDSKTAAGKQVFILRPCMIHGQGNKGNLNVLYKLVKWGIPYPLGKFENQRSFLYVENFSFIVRAILDGKVERGAYNLADTGTISTVELVKLINGVLKRKPRIWSMPKKIMKIVFLFSKATLEKLTGNMVVSNKKICKQVGSLPIPMEEGLTRTILSFNG